MPKLGMLIRIALALGAVAVAVGAAAGAGSAARTSGVTINGAGSSLVAPAMGIWGPKWKAVSHNTVNYSSIGSGSGEAYIANRLVSFGASDAPLSVYAGGATPCKGCVQVPDALTATVPVANIGVRNGKLHLTGTTLALIYLGKITKWNDKRLTKINPGVKLPNKRISVVYRSDGSGDTFVWTHYLSLVNKTWATHVGYSTTITHWPTGTGSNGNSGVAASVAATPGAIGYVGAAYVVNDHLQSASVLNRSGQYVMASIKSIAQAAKAVTKVPKNNEITLLDPPRQRKYKEAFPISTFTYLFLHKNGDISAAATKTTKAYIKWVVTTGQGLAALRKLVFAPMSTIVVNAALKTLNSVKYTP
jgi:phosphate transport system substrate-binding protein